MWKGGGGGRGKCTTPLRFPMVAPKRTGHGQRYMTTGSQLNGAGFDHRVGVVVVDGLEILRLHAEPFHGLVRLQTRRDISRQILDEDRLVVGTLGDGLLVHPFQTGVEFTACGGFGEVDQFRKSQSLIGLDGDGDHASLVVRTPFADRLGAGAQRRDGNLEAEENGVALLRGVAALHADLVIELAAHPRDGSRFLAENRELATDLRVLRLEPRCQILRQTHHRSPAERLGKIMQCLHEAAHVGAFQMGGQLHGHLEFRDRVHNRPILAKVSGGVAEFAHAHPVDHDLAVIRLALCIRQSFHTMGKNPTAVESRWT